eukprot:62863_1
MSTVYLSLLFYVNVISIDTSYYHPHSEYASRVAASKHKFLPRSLFNYPTANDEELGTVQELECKVRTVALQYANQIQSFRDQSATSDALNIAHYCNTKNKYTNPQIRSYVYRSNKPITASEYMIYVDPINGNDNNNGNENSPFKTIEKALNTLRSYKSNESIKQIIIRKGTVYLSSTINLSPSTYDNNLLIDTVTNDKWINITGDLYVSVLTPFSMDLETFKYYQYQLLSAPFTINIPKSIYFLDTFNVFLFSATVIAVYKETEHDFNIIILTESAEYIQLANLILITSPNNNQNINLFNNIQIDNDCISDKNYICSQIWKIKATNVECPYTFDGTYGFQWHAVCSNDTLCQQYLQQNGNIVTLTTNLSFTDNICDPEIWSINFNGMINYYDDNNYITEKEDGFEYIIGIDRVYVELVVDVPIETNYSIFDVEAYNIWLCTTTLETQLYSDPNDIENTGCFDPRVTGLYHIIKDKNELFTADAQHEISDRTNVARFSFIIPSNVNNDKIYIEIQAKLSLMDNNNRTQTITPRLLLSSKDTASQISHFIDYIFVKSENRNNQTTQIDNKSYFIVVVIILTIIIIILCLIVMYCMVKKNKYSKIKESNKEITTQMSTHQTNHNPSIIEINSNEN